MNTKRHSSFHTAFLHRPNTHKPINLFEASRQTAVIAVEAVHGEKMPPSASCMQSTLSLLLFKSQAVVLAQKVCLSLIIDRDRRWVMRDGDMHDSWIMHFEEVKKRQKSHEVPIGLWTWARHLGQPYTVFIIAHAAGLRWVLTPFLASLNYRCWGQFSNLSFSIVFIFNIC